MLVLNTVIKTEIERLWSRFWSGGISNPLSAIEQITYLLFMRRLDDLDAFEEKEAKKLGRKFVSRFDGLYYALTDTERKNPIQKSELRWSFFSKLPADKMLDHVHDSVFPFIKMAEESNSSFSKWSAPIGVVRPEVWL